MPPTPAPRPPEPASYAEPEDETHGIVVALARAVNMREAWKLQRRYYLEETTGMADNVPLPGERVAMRLALLNASRKSYDEARRELRAAMGCRCATRQ